MGNDSNKKSGAILVIMAAMLWGTTGTSQALAPAGITPLSIGAIRLAIGGLTLLTFALFQGTLKGLRSWPIVTTLIAALSMATYQPFFFAGVSKTGVAVGTIVALGSSPVFAGILAYVVRGEKPGIKWMIATGLAVFGNILLILSGKAININILGMLLASGAGLAYAIYTLASKKLLDNYPSEMVVAVVSILGAFFLSPLLFFSDLSWLMSFRGVGVALHLGVLTVAVAYTLFVRGLLRTSVADAVTLTLVEPLTAATLGIFLLGEKLNSSAAFGMGLLFFGIVILSVNWPIFAKEKG